MTFILLIVIRNGIVVPSIFPNFFVCWNKLKFYLMFEKIRTMIWFKFSFSKLVWPLTVFCMSENQIRSLPCSLFTEFEIFLRFFDVIFERFWMFEIWNYLQNRQHRCWWRKVETKCVGDNFDVVFVTKILYLLTLASGTHNGDPTFKRYNRFQSSVTNIKLPSSTCHQHLCNRKII